MARKKPDDHWRKVDDVTWELVGTDYLVKHCGHPTANWPYYVLDPDGRTMIARNGHGFRLLADAKAAARREAEEPWPIEERIIESCLPACLVDLYPEMAGHLRAAFKYRWRWRYFLDMVSADPDESKEAVDRDIAKALLELGLVLPPEAYSGPHPGPAAVVDAAPDLRGLFDRLRGRKP